MQRNTFLLVLVIAALLWFGNGGAFPIPGVLPGPVVVEGPRQVVIVHEASDDTPAFARMTVALRTGANSDYLKAKKHSLLILDDDSVDKDGNPSPALQVVRPQLTGLTMPVLFVVDPQSKAIVHKQSLPATATADEVMAILKAHGG